MITVHKGSATFEDLQKITAVTPKNAGSRWQAIQHAELVTEIKQEVERRGWRVKDQKFSIARDGADMAGALQLTHVKDVPAVRGATLSLGFLNSNARRKALRITVGLEITCCTNGMCTGDILLNRVHDHTVDLPIEIQRALDRYTIAAQHLPSTVSKLRERRLTRAEASEVLMSAGRARLVGWTAIGRVDREYRKPTFKQHGKDTSWALLNAFTYAARKNIAPTRQMQTYNDFLTLLPQDNLN